jgi:hypothetical protein
MQLAPQRFDLLITSHHVICDGWSFGVVARELMMLYQAMVSGTGPKVLLPADSFGDFALSLHDPEHAKAADTDAR